MKAHEGEYSITHLCHAMKVSRTGYHAWKNREPSARTVRRMQIAAAAELFYMRSAKIYGYRKVYEDILDEAFHLKCCRETLRKIMAELGLFSRVKRKYKVTTNSDHTRKIAKNTLNRNFKAKRKNEKWASDITYIHTQEGWLYLAGIMDLRSRKIVGWSMSENIDTTLVCDALQAALMQRRPTEGLLHHSDRGVQYASDAYQKILQDNGIECSMSRKGDCWDNACKESFFGKLKSEWLADKSFKTRNEAKQEVFWYIEVFHNRNRRHASLGYVSPVNFENSEAKGKVA